uniref:Solute carrier family 5 member 1 n=1 Tax=Mustela putorius furo TaxID=9669 RepID=M3XU98_MUSPF
LWNDIPIWSTLGSGISSALDILVMVLYFLLVLGIGLWSFERIQRGKLKLFLAGRSLAWWPTKGASLFASNIGSGHFLGTGIGAASGIAPGAFEWNTLFLLCVLGWVFSPIYIKAEVTTMPEYLRKRFGGFQIQLLLDILYLFLYIFNKISVEICTGAMFMRLVWGLDVYLATIVLLTVTGVYTITDEVVLQLWFTDTLHAVIMVLESIILMGFAFREVGGYPDSKPDLIHKGNWTAEAECFGPHLDFFQIFRDPITGDLPWPGIIFSVSTLSLYYWCTDQQIFVQQCLAGKNMSHVKGGKPLPMFSKVMPGVISRVLLPDKVACGVVPSLCEKYCGIRTGCSSITYPVLVVKLLPEGIQGLMLSALWASLMSSLTSIFNCASALFTMGIYNQIRPTATEKELMVTGRFFVIILFTITIIWVSVIQTVYSNLFEYTHAVMSYLTPPIAAIFLLAIFFKRVTEQGRFGLNSFMSAGKRKVWPPHWCLHSASFHKNPLIICGVHYLYFAVILFIISHFTFQGISLFTDLILDKHLHQLFWSLRDIQEASVDLDEEIQRRRGAPGKKSEDSSSSVPASRDRMLQGRCRARGNFPRGRGTYCAKGTEHNDMWAGIKYVDMSEIPFWRQIANACGFLSISAEVLLHIYYY